MVQYNTLCPSHDNIPGLSATSLVTNGTLLVVTLPKPPLLLLSNLVPAKGITSINGGCVLTHMAFLDS